MSAPAPVRGLPSVNPEPYITRQELASRMGVSVSTVDAMRKEGLPWVSWGRRTVRFRASTAIAWAQSRQRGENAA